MTKTLETFSIKEAVDFIVNFKWITICVVEIFTTDTHVKLLNEFQLSTDLLKNLSVEDIISLATNNNIEFSTISNFISKCDELKLSRIPTHQNINKSKKLNNQMIKGLTPKKQTEVRLFSAKINSICEEISVKQIVDFGAGLGHLDSILAVEYGYHVTGIESNEKLSVGAKINSSRFTLKTGSLKHFNKFIETSEKLDLNNKDQSHYLICGLHACGNLSVACINQFLASENVKSLALVSCCYNLLTPSSFPLSKEVKSTGINFLAPQLMLASQSVIRWGSSNTVHLTFTKHFFRSLLQLVIRDHNLLPNSEAIKVGKLSKSFFESGFVSYALEAFRRLNIPHQNMGILLREYELNYEPHYKSVCLFWTLRASIAGVIESLILVDRAKYISESSGNIEISLGPIFDECESPRNMLLVGVKHD